MPVPPEPAGRPWRDYLALWTRAQRDMLLERRWLLPIVRLSPPLGPRRLLWLDRLLAALDGMGWTTVRRSTWPVPWPVTR
ncbi:hypothetical protein GUY59_11375 [Nonomuraea sp. K271]|nr:hypothetical protein [Nonomuraea sp. K271]